MEHPAFVDGSEPGSDVRGRSTKNGYGERNTKTKLLICTEN
jgi:hypothetical protein